MSTSDIISTLHLDKKNSQGHVIVVKEVNGCDSWFISSCIIGHHLKNKSPVLLITFHNTLTHYQNIGLKLNYSLKKCMDIQLADVYNVGDDIVNNLLIAKEISLANIFANIKKRASELLKNQNSVCIIFDGISHLFDLQYSLKDVNIFMRDITSYVREIHSLVLFHTNVATEDDVTCVMSNMLSHMAQTVVEVLNLPTGLSADVSGHLIVKHIGNRFETDNMMVMYTKPLCYLFKLFERGVKLFAPGVV